MCEAGYTTLLNPCTGEYRERRSVFLAFGFPLSGGFSEVRTRRKTLRAAHPSAHHCCYGAVLDAQGESFCQSDDGEPAGTAGRPILGVIRAAGLKCVLVLVVRYYGGVKLGVPGLTAAYRTAAERALEAGTTAEKHQTVYYAISAQYPQLQRVLDFVRATGGQQGPMDYGEAACGLRVGWPQGSLTMVEAWLRSHLAPEDWHQTLAMVPAGGQIER